MVVTTSTGTTANITTTTTTTNTTTIGRRRTTRRFTNFHVLAAFMAGCAFATLLLTLVHLGHYVHTTPGFFDSGGGGGTGGGGGGGMALDGSGSSSSSRNGNALISVDRLHAQRLPSTIVAPSSSLSTGKEPGSSKQQQHQQSNDGVDDHPVAGLDCRAHGGSPTDPVALNEMVYWRDIPQDSTTITTTNNTTNNNNIDHESSSSSSSWRSPFNRRIHHGPLPESSPHRRQYLTFEPDGGGFNNIRMSLETVLTMAVAMGRILVLPPSQKMYLLGKSNIDFGEFFPLQALANEHGVDTGVGLEIISMQQFLEELSAEQAKNSNHNHKNLLDDHPLPDNGRTNWDGDTQAVKNSLNPWLRQIATAPGDWDPRTCIAAFPKSSHPDDVEELQQTLQEILHQVEADASTQHTNMHDVLSKLPESYVNHPTPINAPAKDRLREFLAGRDQLCIYDQRLQDAEILHFHGKTVNTKRQSVEKQHELAGGGGRLLVHFYAFLFFQDYRADLWMKRFVRDHVRYTDMLQCAAARVVQAVRQKARENGDPSGAFDSFHIRRGDFQYKKTRVSAEELMEAARAEIPKGRIVYVGTDERKKEFFQPLRDHGWNILFLDDFMHLMVGGTDGEKIDSHYYGMIDQLIASRGEVFFGCWFSTFTGYITRVRGYHSQRLENTNGHDDVLTAAHKMGKLPLSYYYALKEHKTKLHDYWPIKQAFYAREFPSSWWQLDWDVDS